MPISFHRRNCRGAAPKERITNQLAGFAELFNQHLKVSTVTDLKDNDFVVWNKGGTLALTASMPLTGGEDGAVEDAAHQLYLDQAEGYNFNAMGCMSTDPIIKGLYAAFCKRMRDDVGKKFQVVVSNHLADYEGVVSVKNGLDGEDEETAALIPWVTGVVAGTAVNKSATNKNYDGEYTIDTRYSKTELENGIKEGSFMFHMVDEP